MLWLEIVKFLIQDVLRLGKESTDDTPNRYMNFTVNMFANKDQPKLCGIPSRQHVCMLRFE